MLGFRATAALLESQRLILVEKISFLHSTLRRAALTKTEDYVREMFFHTPGDYDKFLQLSDQLSQSVASSATPQEFAQLSATLCNILASSQDSQVAGSSVASPVIAIPGSSSSFEGKSGDQLEREVVVEVEDKVEEAGDMMDVVDPASNRSSSTPEAPPLGQDDVPSMAVLNTSP